MKHAVAIARWMTTKCLPRQSRLTVGWSVLSTLVSLVLFSQIVDKSHLFMFINLFGCNFCTCIKIPHMESLNVKPPQTQMIYVKIH